MNDTEISKRLSLAIGLKPDHIICLDAHVYVDITPKSPGSAGWRIFSHKDWSVAGPIAERYDCFPRKDGGWYVWGLKLYDTPQEAIALAVIGAKK